MAVRRFPIRGEIDVATVPDLQIKLDVLIRATDDDLVLDCEGLTFIDSAGIAMFVYVQRALEVEGRECRIEHLSSRCRRPFEMLGLTEELGVSELDVPSNERRHERVVNAPREKIRYAQPVLGVPTRRRTPGVVLFKGLGTLVGLWRSLRVFRDGSQRVVALAATACLIGGGALATVGVVATPASASPTLCPTNTSCNIFDNTVPLISVTPPLSNPDSGDANAVELGVKFTSDVNGFVTGVRFYKSAANTGTHTGSLWTESGTLLATGTFTGESASGWQYLSFSSAVPITAGTTYVASYHTTVGHYSFTHNAFAAAVDSPPLHALADGPSGTWPGNGVYLYGAGGFPGGPPGGSGGAPGGTFMATSYFVDVQFETACTDDCYVNAATGNDSNSGNPDSPLATIQAGVNTVSPGSTVHVAAGTYRENVNVTKAMTIDGASQAGVIVEPGVSQPVCTVPADTSSLCSSNEASVVFRVQASNVNITHLTVDGNNPTISSGVMSNGVDVDARDGIESDFNSGSGNFNNLSVSNVTVKNIYLRGIEFTDNTVPSTGFNANNDTVDNVQGDPASIGIFVDTASGIITGNTISRTGAGVATNHSLGTAMSNNIVTTSDAGVHSDNNGDGVGAVADSIMGNNVTCSATAENGVFVFVPYLNQTVSGNIVSGCKADATAGGLAVYGSCKFVTISPPQCAAAPTINFTNNASTGNTNGLAITTDTLGFGNADVKVTGDHNDLSSNPGSGPLTGAGVAVVENAPATATVTVTRNSVASEGTVGVFNTGPSAVSAKCNWWGSSAGPPGLTAGPVDASTWLVTSNLNGPCPEPTAPTIVSVTPVSVSVSPTSVSVAFNPAPPNGNPVLFFTATCISLDGMPPVSATGPASPITVPGLFVFDPYVCSVTATNSAGTSLPSGGLMPVWPTHHVVACGPVPSAPFNLTDGPADRGAQVSWAPSATGCIAGFVVTPYLNGVAQPATLIPGHGTTTVIKGLTTGATYTFTVAGENGIDVGPASVQSPSVTVGTPGVPSILSASRAGRGALTVSFRAATSNGAKVLKYTATCSSKHGVTRTKPGPSSPLTVTGLTSARTYTCTVKATNSRGTGPPSAKSLAIRA